MVRQVVAGLDPKTFCGTLIAVPIVNVLGFSAGQRYLPDRRDLNRSFPGSPRGSLAGRIAHLFMTEVVDKCEVGIDLHTGSDRRTNLPQVRADLEDPRTRALAEAFAAPVMLNAKLRDGSLRLRRPRAGRDRPALRGGRGVADGPLGRRRRRARRAPRAGRARDDRAGGRGPARALGGLVPQRMGPGARHRHAPPRGRAGERVERGARLGGLFDSLGKRVRLVHADRSGIVVGRTEAPLVNSGDAVVHIAEVEEPTPPGTAGS